MLLVTLLLLVPLVYTPAIIAQDDSSSGKWELRVCADGNHLPYTNKKGEGFENQIARLAARKMNAKLSYYWHPQRRAFIRSTLREGHCDVIMGVPDRFELLLTTQPYYRSSYVFLHRKDADFTVDSLDDKILHDLTIGVQLIGDDYTNSPPAHSLAARQIRENLEGFSVFGDYDQPNPLSNIVEAVANGEVDLAIPWGPVAGFFARRSDVPMVIKPVKPRFDAKAGNRPMVYSISMGVRRNDQALRDDLDEFIRNNREEIQRILEENGIPTLPIPGISGNGSKKKKLDIPDK